MGGRPRRKSGSGEALRNSSGKIGTWEAARREETGGKAGAVGVPGRVSSDLLQEGRGGGDTTLWGL